MWCGRKDIQNIILDTPKYLDKFLGENVFDTLEHFCQTKKYNEIGWLVLIVLEKVEKGKDELRDLNSQFKYHINDLKFPMSALKETLTSIVT